MASLMARGERVTLEPAALTYLYHGLRRVGAMTDSRCYNVEVPWHYLYEWIHEHVLGVFSCPETPQYFKERYYPFIMELRRAIAAIDIAQIITFMFAPSCMIDRFQIVHQLQLHNLLSQCMDYHMGDILTESNVSLLLSKLSHQSIVEYFGRIMLIWLCYRRHESIVLKRYNLTRVARQYGLSQSTPLYGLPRSLIPDHWDNYN